MNILARHLSAVIISVDDRLDDAIACHTNGTPGPPGCPLLALSGRQRVPCTCLLMTQNGRRVVP